MKSNKLAKNGEEAEQSKTDSQNVQQEQQAAKKTKNETKTPYHSMSKKSKNKKKMMSQGVLKILRMLLQTKMHLF